MVVEGAACHAGLFGYLGNCYFSRILFAAEKIERRQEIFLGLGISDIFARVVHGDYSFSLFPISLIPLGLSGCGANKFSSLPLEHLKYGPPGDALRSHF